MRRPWGVSLSSRDHDGDAAHEDPCRPEQDLDDLGPGIVSFGDDERRPGFHGLSGFVGFHLAVRGDHLHIRQRWGEAVSPAGERQILLDAEARVVWIRAGSEDGAFDDDIAALERYDESVA